MNAINLSGESRIVVSKDQVSCDLAGEAAILNLKSGIYFGLDPVGARVWSLVQKPTTFANILLALLTEYHVAQAQLEPDIRELLGKLAEQGLIDITP